jgi:NAD+ synthase (glutamine-hydrolysing)
MSRTYNFTCLQILFAELGQECRIGLSCRFQLKEVEEIVTAPPTAELKPLESNQTDEEDMGMTYEELSFYGKLRKPMACGPFSMVARLLHLWKDKHDPPEIARKVKHFYTSYAINR